MHVRSLLSVPEVSQVGSVSSSRVCDTQAPCWKGQLQLSPQVITVWRPEQGWPAFLFSSTWWSLIEKIGRLHGTVTAAPNVPSLKLFSLFHFVTGHPMPWVLWVVSGVGERSFVLFSSLGWAVLDRSLAYPTYGSRDSLRTLHKGGDGWRTELRYTGHLISRFERIFQLWLVRSE